jgi:hypothetical protein
VAVRTAIDLAGLQPTEVRVEVVMGRVGTDGGLEDTEVLVLPPTGLDGSVAVFEKEIVPDRTGRLGYALRISPNHCDDPLTRPLHQSAQVETSKLLLTTTLGIFCTLAAIAQNPNPIQPNVPIYRVTVVDRTVSAIDYQYRNGPTNIDFRGTVLLPQAKGGAIVESKAGRTEIDAHFDRLLAPTRFGREYLTYVLWAITPDGHAKNLGEILPGSSDKAKLQVTTDLQAFGLIVTAEPYSAVRQPSDVVVLENEPRPDTIGGREPIQAKYELLPRGHYTYNVQEGLAAADATLPGCPRINTSR